MKILLMLMSVYKVSVLSLIRLIRGATITTLEGERAKADIEVLPIKIEAQVALLPQFYFVTFIIALH